MTNDIFRQGEKTSLSSAAKETGNEIPVEIVSLPSKGMLYPQEHPLYNEESVEIKAMTAREEDLLTSRALIKNKTVTSALMKACILNKLVDPEDLLIGDRNAILIGIRVTGYGADYGVKIQCPECQEEFDNHFSLSKLKIKPLTGTPIQSNVNLFSFKLPLSGQEVQFRLLTGKDEVEMDLAAERKKKLGSQVENSITARLFQSIVSVNGETDRGKLNNIVNNFRAADARALRNYMKEIMPDVDMKQEAMCTKCSAVSEVDVPIGPTFFWPDIDV
jgi:hypothetical protein